MRNTDRIEPFLETVKDVWEAHPDMRLGQLLLIAALRNGWTSFDLFHIEDAQLHEGLIKVYTDFMKKKGVK